MASKLIVPKVTWPDLLVQTRWRQGEHVTLIGPTGIGKTTLAIALLPLRTYTVVIATKPKDTTLDKLAKSGFEIVREWPPPKPPQLTPKVIFWPKATKLSDYDAQTQAISKMMHRVYQDWNWCVYIDELAELTDMGLKREMKQFWQRGRSIGISFVTATQRPAWVPLDAYSQATHLFLWRTGDRRDLNRLSDISGAVDVDAIRSVVSGLTGHDFLYINTRTGTMLVSNAKG